ncbi:hypothetical protein BGX28_006906 [Mortierella sp. GBA30]|nr:hypothetical protein BGX28_006906 [Mortierella sp. GBA30]
MSNVEIYRRKVEELISEADITTVSARRIRKQIEAHTNSSLDNVKREFDEMVMEIYEKITDDIERAVLNGTQPSSNNAQQSQQQQQQQSSGFGLALPPTSYVPPPKPKPAASSSTNDSEEDDDEDDDDSDASYSSVDEGKRHPRKKAKTSATSSTKTKKASATSSSAKAKAKTKTSASKKNTDKEKEKPKVKAKRKQPVNEDGTPKVNNFTRPMVISDKLHEVIGHAGSTGPSGRVEMSRPEVVKQMWAYIKGNSLQNEKDGREIICDDKLKNLFGQDRVNSFSMNKYLSSHLSKPEELL